MQRILTSEVLQHAGGKVRLAGWVHNIRAFREVKFIVLRDRGGLIQAIIDPESDLDVSEIGKEFVIEIEGQAVAEDRAPRGVEIHLESIKVLGTAQEPPLEINRPKVFKKTHLDKILDYRTVSLRELSVRAVFEVQDEILRAFAEHLRSEGFTEVKTSKIVGTGTEGGANVFEIDYFGKPAFLAQSPQFYKQIMVGSGLERVFEIGYVYRAEKHETSRHINEYCSLDYEMGFIESEQDVIAMQVGLMRHICNSVNENCAGALEMLGATVPEIGETIPQIEFNDAVEIVRAEGHKGPPGDLDPEGERRLCEWSMREHGSEFLYVVGFPLAKRPVYTNFRADNPEISCSFDLLFRGLEITTGSQRIHDYDLLVSKMREKGYNPDEFDYYTSAFRHGMPPHGGLGLGLERFTMKLLGLSNVKEATLFPRDRNRIRP